MTENENIDYSETFDKQLKKFRPWAIGFLIWFAVIILSPLLMAMLKIDLKYYLEALPILLIFLFPLSVKMYAAGRCPACGKYMGRDMNQFCSNCGVRLRKKTSNKN